jgi:hypothetical protein
VRRLLLSALRALLGSVATVSQNGTGDKLDIPTATAAQIKVRLAIEDLLKAQASGTNTTALIALLRRSRLRFRSELRCGVPGFTSDCQVDRSILNVFDGRLAVRIRWSHGRNGENGKSDRSSGHRRRCRFDRKHVNS